MDVTNVIKSPGDVPWLRGVSEDGGVVSVTAGGAGQSCSRQVPSCPACVSPCHTDSCCLNTGDSGSGQALADVQACKNTGLGTPLTVNSLPSEQADTPTGNHTGFVKDGSANAASVPEIYAEKAPSVSDDFSDDDLEYFECSDVLTAHEEEIWKKKLQFLLESDDEDDLNLSKDCDGCAYFLSEVPCVSQVSDDTTPMDAPIGFCGHHSTFKGVNVRRDPSMYSQSSVQAEMTLAVGHHRDKSASVKDKDQDKAPVASAAAGDEHPRGEEEAGGSSGDSSARGAAVAAGTEPGAVPGEGRNVPQENTGHAVCTLREILRRNLLKLFNPLELCRYVGTIGPSLQAAAEGGEPRVPSASQEGALPAQSPRETESPWQTEEADKDSHWERNRTRGLSEQNQLPDENISLGNQGANLEIVTQNCESLCVEPEREKESTFGARGSAGSSQPAAEMLSAENTLQAKDADPQTSLHAAPCGEREGRHQEPFSGQEMTSNGNKSKNDISAFPSGSTDCVPDEQECLSAVVSCAKLCDEAGQAEQRDGSSDPDILCSLSGDEANPQPALESGEPGCKGDADISAGHDNLWKLLQDDDSDCQIPFENKGITSLEMRPPDTKVTELSFVLKTCSNQPLPMGLKEQEPVPGAASYLSTGKAACSGSDAPQRDGVCQGASMGKPCLAQVAGTDGVCLDCSAGNERETPSICASANSVLVSAGESLGTHPDGSSVAAGGKLTGNSVPHTWGADSPHRLQNAQRGNSACPRANPASMSDLLCGTAGHSTPLISESVSGEGCCYFRGCYPARGGLAYFPGEKGIFPRENTCQAEHSSVNTTRESCEVNSREKGNHSDLNAQSDTNSDSCHLSKNNVCQDFHFVSGAQRYGCVMQLPTLIKSPKTITRKNLPQNTEQLTETAKQEGSLTPSLEGPFLRDFHLEIPSCEPCKPGGEQREIYTGDEHRAETSCDSGVSQVSEGQAAISPHSTAEQNAFFVEGLKTDSSKDAPCAPGSAPVPRRAPSEGGGGTGHQLDSQQLTGEEALPFPTPVSSSERCLPSVSATACPGTASQLKSGSTQTGARGNRNWSVLEISCRASQGLSQRGPGETRGEAALCEIPRAAECDPGAAGTKAAVHTGISSQAQRQTVNTGTDLIPPSRVTEAGNSVKSPEYDKEEGVSTAESAVSGLINLPPVYSGSSQCFQEQALCSRTRRVSSAPTSCDPFPGNTERQRKQEGSKPCQTPRAAAEPEPTKGKQDTAKGGHSAAGAKKKLPLATLSKKPRLEERGSVSKDPSGGKRSGKSEAGVIHKEDRREQRKLVLKKDCKAPRLLKKIHAESFPDCSGNVKLCCQFGDIHGDSTITWTKDSKLLARLQRRAQDDSPISLEIAEASNKDQGMYYCCLNNAYGKVTAEFHLTAAVLERLSSFQSYEGVEEIEFMQLLFREDSLSDSYFGRNLQGALATEERHFGEGMHRRAFRSRVRRGLAPLFPPGHPCVLKVHSALTHGASSAEELVRKNYSLALQECCVQNAAREYAKLYAAEAETLEGFGEVPEIIPIFLIHRPANNIPYATVEEELVGEFVKYSVKDGKEVNFLRRDSEAGKKCCTFQHWVYEKTSGNLLVTDLQGVGMKLTDVGIATLGKGYKGFKGNCSFSFIEQFRALHQCNEYCEMLGLKPLRTTQQKQRKAAATKSKTLPNSSAVKKMVPKKARERRDFISSEP